MFTSRRKSFIAALVTIFIAAFLWFTLPAAPTRAQAPTPVPTPTLTLTEDCIVNGINKCGERIVRENGLFVFILAALVIGAIAFVGYALLKGATKPLEKKSEEVSSRLLERDDAVTRYLNAVIPDYHRFKFRGFNTRPEDSFIHELDQTYVSLRMTAEADEKRAQRERSLKHSEASPGSDPELAAAMFREQIEPITLAQAIGRAYRLAIVGAAGSGKSTLLQWAGLAMARARIEPKRLTEEQRAFVQAASDKPLLPILIPLRAFHDACVAQEQTHSATALLAFLGKYISEKHPTLALPNGFFEAQLRGAGCLVMFDGVDEMPREERSAVRGAMEDFVAEFKNTANRYLVTSRPNAYFGMAQVAGFEKCVVQNFTPEQRDTLIESWCRATYEGDDQVTQARDLIERLNTADERVRNLAVTPLMTTVFAFVHYKRNKKLPKQRAELYEDAIEILLTEPYRESAPQIDSEERRNGLSAIAFEMHARGIEELPEDDLVALCWRAFGSDEKTARKAARDFLRAVADRGGLLEEENGNYGFFTHRTFREFLAGRFLAEEIRDPHRQRAFLRERLDNEQWDEATCLAAGYLAIKGKAGANDFVLLLADLGENDGEASLTDEQRAHALTLAGNAFSDLPPKIVQAETQTRVSQALLDFFQATPPRVEPRLRRPLGLALGAVGDSRFARSPLVVGEGAGWRLPQVVPIPAGEFLMGTSDDEEKELERQDAQAYSWEKPQNKIYVSEFAIGKYPVTNAEFRAFWMAKGYEKQEYWSDDGWKWRTGRLEANLDWLPSDDLKKSYADWLKNRPVEKRDEPFFWNDPQWSADNLPVVGVTWFEAEAYCNWLSEMVKKGNKEAGKQVEYRLPTEAEWEKAARGPQNYLWSWGNEWDANKCNSVESKFNATSPVGMYPDGTWKDEQGNVGPLDMMGNVWEWCGDWYQGDLYETRAQETTRDPQGPASGNARVVRGGSWGSVRRYCRAAYRLRDVPLLFTYFIGFRVVVVPIPRT
ncbi:MAG: NACHT domain-containing protein [Chloroflexota bacterium]|nr:MAG: NACHT domain-containing protein [Chloroflexota bacterium]